MEIMIFIIFALVIGVFIHSMFSGIVRWNKNNNSPRLIVPALVVSKRMSVSHHHHHSGTNHHHNSTTYYVTFQVESGDRMELQLMGDEYGMIAEGDNGILTFQGTRFLSFDRKY